MTIANLQMSLSVKEFEKYVSILAKLQAKV